MTKKQLIIEEALSLFAEKGFETTSVQEITDACGISKGAFYLAFTSKDELISSMIDYFMKKLVVEIDQVVMSVESDEEVLDAFYTAIFTNFHRHADFAKFFVKEQIQSFDEDLFLQSRIYAEQIDRIILKMAERVYGEQIAKTKYDLIYSVKGLIKAYAELFVFYNYPLDLEALVLSLVEKTNILAVHTVSPFVRGDLPSLCEGITGEDELKEQVLKNIEQNLQEVEGDIEKESLTLLRAHLHGSTLSPAIVKGLIGNIKNHPACKWTAYLLEKTS